MQGEAIVILETIHNLQNVLKVRASSKLNRNATNCTHSTITLHKLNTEVHQSYEIHVLPLAQQVYHIKMVETPGIMGKFWSTIRLNLQHC